jgi:hypothetical protein
MRFCIDPGSARSAPSDDDRSKGVQRKFIDASDAAMSWFGKVLFDLQMCLCMAPCRLSVLPKSRAGAYPEIDGGFSMNVRYSHAVVFLGTIAAALIAAPALAQQPFKAPRTEHGYPDLQGVWTNATITPLLRPEQYADRRAHTSAEAQALEKGIADYNAAADKPSNPTDTVQDLERKGCELRGFANNANCAYNQFWADAGTHLIDINGEKRTSIIIDPPNGRIPPLLPAAQARNAERRERFTAAGANAGPESRSLGERCILSFGSSAGPPMLPLMYNSNYQIVQTKDTVMILVEMVHDVRVIRIGGKHPASHIRKWMGDSVGRYEGDTLVVETTNFHEQQNFQGAAENRKVIERLTRIAPGKILYRFTVEDPTTFAQPLTGEVAMNVSQGHIYEYACHEGNYAMPGILAGAREEERAAAEAAKQGR